MITKSLWNTNRDFVTDCAFQRNILLIMTVTPKQVQPVSLLKIFNFEIFTVQFQSIQLSSKEEQKSSAIWTTFSVFFDGRFVTHEIMSINKFEKLLNTLA